MEGERPQVIVGAVLFMAISTVVIAMATVWGVLGDGLWVAGLDGQVYEAPQAIVVGYGPLVPVGAFIVATLLTGRSTYACMAGFAAWFAVVAADVIVLGSPVATPAFIGAIPMALAYAGRSWFVRNGADG